MNDEIIKAPHATKERLAQDAQLDIKRLIESVQREEAISAAQGRIVLQPPIWRSGALGFSTNPFCPTLTACHSVAALARLTGRFSDNRHFLALFFW